LGVANLHLLPRKNREVGKEVRWIWTGRKERRRRRRMRRLGVTGGGGQVKIRITSDQWQTGV
jgi:hypothetical protein